MAEPLGEAAQGPVPALVLLEHVRVLLFWIQWNLLPMDKLAPTVTASKTGTLQLELCKPVF